jgi:U2 small nuclear ribonucleoprotein A'
MRLTADLIQKSAQYLNAINEFHIDLRGYKIPFLENLTATNDQFGTIDLTDNEIAILEYLP